MIIKQEIEIKKKDLPSGSLNIRWRQMRSHYQAFAGNKYLVLADGETAEEAVKELKRVYNVSESAKIKIH